jgi:hypothetical protein
MNVAKGGWHPEKARANSGSSSGTHTDSKLGQVVCKSSVLLFLTSCVLTCDRKVGLEKEAKTRMQKPLGIISLHHLIR